MQYIEDNKKKQMENRSEELSALIKVASFERKQNKGKTEEIENTNIMLR